MAGKTDTNISIFSQKKLLGKAHTSTLKLDGEEVIGSNIQTSSGLVFGDRIPDSPTLTLNVVQGFGSFPSVEYVEFDLIGIPGTVYDANEPGGGSGQDPADLIQEYGFHAYAFRFPENYLDITNNPKAGNAFFNNRVFLHETLGRAQLVPPFFSRESPNPYIVRLYKENGEEIPLLDNIDWNVDCYNGILFIQDTNPNKVPATAKAFVYVGRMADEAIAAATETGITTYGTNIIIETAWMEIPDGEINGMNITYDLAHKPEPASALLLYVNGVLQKQGLAFDYTIENKQIVFTQAPPSNSSLFATYPWLYFLPTTTKWMDIPSGQTNGSNYVFALAETPNPPESLMFYVDGVLQRQAGTGVIGDYTLNGKEVTMNYIPKAGSNISATYPY